MRCTDGKRFSTFRIVVEVKLMSKKDRLKRKKCLGVWRWGCELIARKMSRFPNRVIRYTERKSPTVKGCNFEFGRNSEAPVMFLGVMCWR